VEDSRCQFVLTTNSPPGIVGFNFVRMPYGMALSSPTASGETIEASGIGIQRRQIHAEGADHVVIDHIYVFDGVRVSAIAVIRKVPALFSFTASNVLSEYQFTTEAKAFIVIQYTDSSILSIRRS